MYFRSFAVLRIWSTSNDVFREPLQLVDVDRFDVEHVDLEERSRVHLVLLVDVRVEPVDDAVGEDAEPGLGDAEVPVQLGRGLFPEIDAVVLALEEHDRVAVPEDRVVDLLALLRPDVGDELRHDLRWIEYVIAEHVVDERHDQGGLRRLLGLHVVDPLLDPARHLA